MQSENNQKYVQVNKMTLAIIVVAMVILGAGLLGWQLGKSTTSSTDRPGTATPSSPSADHGGIVSSLVRYTLPDGWKETSCPSSGSVYISPAGGADTDCNANPRSAVTIAVDPGNTKDCNQLQGLSDVKKHLCVSLYINGQRSLKASTEYLTSSSYQRATTVNTYYIDTGKAVIKVEYIYHADNEFQAGVDQLARSIKPKS